MDLIHLLPKAIGDIGQISGDALTIALVILGIAILWLALLLAVK